MCKLCSIPSTPIDVNDQAQLLSIIKSCLGTKFINRWSELACKIALDAVSTVTIDENGRREIDIKRYAKVEKVSSKFNYLSLIIPNFLCSSSM